MKQLLIEFVIALAIAWTGATFLTACTISPAQAYHIIHGGN